MHSARVQRCPGKSARKQRSLRESRLRVRFSKRTARPAVFGKIYDGTFSGSLTDGNGVFAALLDRHRIEVMTEKEKIEW